jgi:hypothetical protein
MPGQPEPLRSVPHMETPALAIHEGRNPPSRRGSFSGLGKKDPICPKNLLQFRLMLPKKPPALRPGLSGLTIARRTPEVPRVQSKQVLGPVIFGSRSLRRPGAVADLPLD